MIEIPDKQYFKIGEVARIVGVKPSVLRYWETEFRSIRPEKSRTNQRLYARRHVERLLDIKELLYERRFTIAGARQRLREPHDEAEGEGALGAERARRALARVTRELRELLQLVGE